MLLSDFSSVVSIDKGWSGDRKYFVTDADGNDFVVRISPSESIDKKKSIFDMMHKFYSLGVPMCMPVEFGFCDDGVYLIESRIIGDDAENILPSMTSDEQYNIGVKAGRIQKKIHSIPCADNDWGRFFRIKAESKIHAFLDCGVSFSGADIMIRFICENLHLLDSRPKTLQHGDFHRGNLIITPDQEVVVLDFDRLDWGDPWEDLKAITWDVQLSPSFASGRIDGYFDGAVPKEFWRLLALYICVGTLSSFPWALPFGQGEIDTMIGLANEVLDWYGEFSDPVPNWYIFEV